MIMKGRNLLCTSIPLANEGNTVICLPLSHQSRRNHIQTVILVLSVIPPGFHAFWEITSHYGLDHLTSFGQWSTNKYMVEGEVTGALSLGLVSWKCSFLELNRDVIRKSKLSQAGVASPPAELQYSTSTCQQSGKRLLQPRSTAPAEDKYIRDGLSPPGTIHLQNPKPLRSWMSLFYWRLITDYIVGKHRR